MLSDSFQQRPQTTDSINSNSITSQAGTYDSTAILFMVVMNIRKNQGHVCDVKSNTRVDFIKESYFLVSFQAFSAGFIQMTAFLTCTPFHSNVLPSLSG